MPTSNRYTFKAKALSHTIFLSTVILSTPVEAYVDKFAVCKDRVNAVLNGTGTIGNISNATIWDYDYIYTGLARELVTSFPRNEFLTLTYKGNHCS
jgi:hypothetical protein